MTLQDARRETNREERDKELTANATALPTGQKYSVIYADPPDRESECVSLKVQVMVNVKAL